MCSFTRTCAASSLTCYSGCSAVVRCVFYMYSCILFSLLCLYPSFTEARLDPSKCKGTVLDSILIFREKRFCVFNLSSMYNCQTRQHTSAYVSIRQHTSAYISIRQTLRACAPAGLARCPSSCVESKIMSSDNFEYSRLRTREVER